MNHITGSVWHITDEEEFWAECDFAGALFAYVEAAYATRDVPWFFEEGYMNQADRRFTVIFGSYRGDAYKDCLLSIEAWRDAAGKLSYHLLKLQTGH